MIHSTPAPICAVLTKNPEKRKRKRRTDEETIKVVWKFLAPDPDEEAESLCNEATEKRDAEEVAEPPVHCPRKQEPINPNLPTVPVEEVCVADGEDELDWELRNGLGNIVT